MRTKYSVSFKSAYLLTTAFNAMLRPLPLLKSLSTPGIAVCYVYFINLTTAFCQHLPESVSALCGYEKYQLVRYNYFVDIFYRIRFKLENNTATTTVSALPRHQAASHRGGAASFGSIRIRECTPVQYALSYCTIVA